MSDTAYLILENGTTFEGKFFGAQGEVTGEIVFTTGMTGYLETLTDQSYYGQIVLQTFPLIGNYGVITADFESADIGARAYIVKYPCATPSNFRSEKNLDAFLKERGIIGLCGIDTRSITKIIRTNGVMNGKISPVPPTDAALAEIKAYSVVNAVASVSSRNIEKTGGKEQHGEAVWMSNAIRRSPNECFNNNKSGFALANPVGAGERRVVLMDFGAKRGIAAALAARGCEVWTFPHNATAQEIMQKKPHGIMLGNGPGDPAEPANSVIIETIRALLQNGVPIFGICLGHQLLALAKGYKTKKLKFGHRGANQPVKETATGRVYITSQNHGYAVVAANASSRSGETSPPAEASFVNVNDGTCEGMDYGVSFSVQFHPEACGGPLDTSFLFDRFIKRMDDHAAR